MPSGRDYANRLLEEANRTYAPHLSGLQEALQSLRNHLTASLDQLAPKFDAIRTVELAATGNILAEAIEEVHRQRQQDIAFIADFGRGLRQKETQEEILAHLLDAAHRYAPRVALLVERKGQFLGWSSRGFSFEVERKIRSSSADSSASPALRLAAAADGVITIQDTATEKALLQFLPGDSPGPWHLAPMRTMNRNVAVLLAANTAEQRCDVNALQILVDLAGLYTESVALRVLHEMKPEETREPAAEAPPVEPARPAEPPVLPVQEAEVAPRLPETTVESEVTIPIPAAAPIHEEREEAAQEPDQAPATTILEPVEAAPARGEPDSVEMEADREIEALVETIGKAAPGAVQGEIVEVRDVPAPAEPVISIPRPLADGRSTLDEERLHADARRFARLLVSEIKLYNEQRLTEGREHRDIYVRLKRDLDKSREMYEKRVPQNVSRKFDYFNDEVIRILAENDPTKLGSDYPGPRVES